uniref:Uncharacterized protein n=1 Tax=Lepeophtheirus salmonis TaxID=72036 RepID=A0A0K2V2X4_LEPSM
MFHLVSNAKRLSSKKTIRRELEVSSLYNYPYTLYITKTNL